MTLSRRPLVDARGSTWLGDPDVPDFSIEVTDDALVMCQPSGTTVVHWADIASIDATIPTAPWWLARGAFWVLSTIDTAEGAASQGAHSGTTMRRGNCDIEIRVIRRDGSEVVGWAAKHQAFGYPAPEAAAALAVLRERIRG